ncbi:MAG: S1 family peptidase [Actinomycetota bacterium]
MKFRWLQPSHFIGRQVKGNLAFLSIAPFYFFLIIFPSHAVSKTFFDFKTPKTHLKQLPPCETIGCEESTESQLNELAKSITVKVFSGQAWGSGILLQRQGQIYTVVTNRHVLTQLDPPYFIQTPDGRIYEAHIPTKNLRFNGNDLGIIQFSSAGIPYPVASLRSSRSLSEGERVFAAGFPFGEPGFVLTSGWVSLLPEQALEQGYQIGSTNEIQKGMSGGPLLNLQGEVVGINGMHAYPLWGDPYVYQDGSLPSEEVRDLMVRSAFAIPIETFAQLAPQFASIPDDLPTPYWEANSRQRFSHLFDLLGLMPARSVVRRECTNHHSCWE